jgi:hypothetical protein
VSSSRGGRDRLGLDQAGARDRLPHDQNVSSEMADGRGKELAIGQM